MDGKDAEHLRVLRVRRGELLTVCDGRGTDYICRVTKVENGSAEAAIIEAAPSAGEPDVACAVYAALPKGDKAEHIIQKAVELGPRSSFFSSPSAAFRGPTGPP
jgi:16S rRNA (uracil1498-N3)-methyltransferase